jgi:protein TonB
MKWIANELKYPAIAQENGVQGRVTVRFIINKDGSVSDAIVVKGIDPHLDKEALRVISKMPNWKPGKQRGQAVRVSYNLPVRFKLN